MKKYAAFLVHPVCVKLCCCTVTDGK